MLFIHSSTLRDEEALIKGCIKGDRIYQNKLYKTYAAQMLGLCMRYAKTKEDAEDILQEGFMQVFKSIRQYKNTGPLESWIKKIFINCALQKLRDKKNKYAFIEIDAAPEMYMIDCTASQDIDRKILLRCIQNLPFISRLVFNLYVFEGFKHKEIAGMLKISEGTSKSNLFDARNNLKKQLKHYNLFFTENAANE